MAEPFWRSDEIVQPKAAAPEYKYFWTADEIVQPSMVRPDGSSPPMPGGYAPPPEEAPSKPGMLMSGARGAMQGLTFGLADESYGLMKGLGSMVSGGGFTEGYNQGVEEYRARDKVAKAANPVSSTVGEIAGGMGTGLGLAKGGVTLMRAGMNLPQAMMAGAAEGAGYGAAYGAGNAEGGIAERLDGALDGGKTGFVVGGAVPLVARGIGAATRLASPVTTDPNRRAMAQILEAEGIPTTAGQRSQSKPLLYAESILGDAPLAGGRSQAIMTQQAEAFTDAAMRRVGSSGRATPDNMSQAYDRIGQSFRDLSARNTLRADPQLGQDIGAVLREYDRVLTPDRRRVVGDLATDIVERLRTGNGTMSGRDYQTIRSRLGKRAEAAGTDTDYRDAMRRLRNAMDNAMTRSISSPADAAAWGEARRQYGNWKDLAKAAGGAGANAADGLVSPQALRQAVASGRNKEAYVRGQGDFADLVRAGNSLLTPLPNSGTAQRVTVASGATGLAGALAGNGNILSAAAAAVGPGLAGRALLSPAMQRYLDNPAIGPATRRAIEAHAQALLQGGAQSQSQSQYLKSPRR